MTKVTKSNDRVEDFSRDKIAQSLRNVGVDDAVASEVASDVETHLKDRDSVTTATVRATVAENLRKRDSKAAMRYENTRRLEATKASKALKGTAYLSEQTLKMLNLRSGDELELRHADNKLRLKAEIGNPQPRAIGLSEDDLRSLHVPEGTRIQVLHPI